ncbi:MAG: 30S ribosomal protein S12 methylthiotransferase RimO [Sarcina ventriculi]|uniref:Ribosomal protein uS12 methylthiotransferase RimO n=1 Tax=Sarcina ventriculi TaxID=1267 RepID=A0ABP2ALZ9_SARVE|nr:30S ribosomal protein S12 methylthiotransferase RimO [Sarcina ventriculi]MBU5321765.1 30S ribosomal protein S12 methylthiotransferase RimO [Sarcina ventriculi]MCI5636707.1 30S ribosomal protein S12 methylthiotransferase RimO [Sarcina ventriculi]MDD7373056.1 30S ribosomal protein S12 methylthiotransferase RimO [Sarcina ventriculi]MDY7063245.1 30S ribosomal protein S12 methylthiotransferase RimO [Sarcina ventriculi]CUN47006.1 Ribosomal protein S12 methylthiotransferase RimO [Sarcina ventricul
MTKYKVGMVSLGCDKNRVDSEIMLGQVEREYELTNNPKEADIIIVNTCGFIEKAKQESINTILDMAKYKIKYKCKLLIATGCLTQRYGKELLDLMPELDIVLGVNDYEKINKAIEGFIKENKKISSTNFTNEGINEGKRIITTNKSSAYLRIAEGCNNFCTYCIIPKIRGKFRSRKIENIIEEGKILANAGVKEIILIAQDTTNYGIDLYNEKRLHIVLRELSKIEGIEFIRVMYCYPEAIYRELIEEISKNDKVCKYLDLPIQHISNDILKRMGRKTSKEEIIDKIKTLRENVSNIVLRTSLIVGFPGETEEDFNELKEFLKEMKLDKVGVFTYSQEEDTPAALMENQIDEKIKQQREKELMEVQKEVSKAINKSKIGRTYKVLVESENSDYFIGRSYEMAPDIDGLIYIKEKNLKANKFYDVKIKEALEYDLIGVVLNESCK